MTRPRWLTLGPQEMVEMRSVPAVQMIMEWLEWERFEAREGVLRATVSPRPGADDPKLRAGIALAIDAILQKLNTPAPIAEMSDEDFVDPATRPSLRKDRDAEV